MIAYLLVSGYQEPGNLSSLDNHRILYIFLSMKIHFYGATRTVTGAQFLLEVNGMKILLDCGMFQGSRKESYEKNKNLPFDASKVDLCILSHAHIDHCGNLPNLVKKGFRGDIICTYATRDLCAIMLRDSAKIQMADIEYINKKIAADGGAALEPIYTVEDALASLKYFLGLAYDRPRKIAPGITLTLLDAGHILGSAITVLDIEDKDTGKSSRFVFSGDLGRANRPILCDPEAVESADTLLIESTYGDREHEETEKAVDKLARIVNEAYKTRSKIIIPSFAIGRTQELAYRLNQLINEKLIPADIPIYVDSPLAIEATGIYRLHPEAFDEEAYDEMINAKDGDPFGSGLIHYTRNVEESKKINEVEGPAIIISASGMAEAGRILHHLKNNISNPNNIVLIVGFQAPDTLGRRLVEKAPSVRIFGIEYPLRARVEKINGFSGHADKNELFAWLGNFRKKPSHTFIVHGEEKTSLAFCEELKRRGFAGVQVPRALEMREV
jgi:metallo-beta-lactamase family protein